MSAQMCSCLHSLNARIKIQQHVQIAFITEFTPCIWTRLACAWTASARITFFKSKVQIWFSYVLDTSITWNVLLRQVACRLKPLTGLLYTAKILKRIQQWYLNITETVSSLWGDVSQQWHHLVGAKVINSKCFDDWLWEVCEPSLHVDVQLQLDWKQCW